MKKQKGKLKNEQPDDSFFFSFKNPKFLALLIGLAVFVVYFKAIGFEFVNFDDHKEILKNQQIINFSFQNFIDLFIRPNGDLYIPLVNLSFNIEHFFFGFNPKIFHFTNIIFHVFNSILVFWISLKLFNNIKFSFLVAIIFGVHPFRVESVAWIIERKDVMYAFFFLLSFYSYHLFCTSTNKKFYLISIVLFIFSCFSKPMAVTFPAVLLIYDYFYFNKKGIKIVFDKIPFLIISGLMSIVAVKLINAEIAYLPMIKVYTFLDKLILFFHSLFFYFEKTILPFNFSAIYNYPTKINGHLNLYYYITSTICFLVLISVFLFRRKDKIVISVVLLYLVTISPVIQIFPNTYSITADRYAYIPSLFLIGYLIHVSIKIFNKNKMKTTNQYIVIIGFVSVFSILTVLRLNIWKNSETLYIDILKNKQETPAILCNYGDLLVEENRMIEAEILLVDANKKFPLRSEILARLANTYFNKKNYNKAVFYYSEAVKIDSTSSEILTNFGASYINMQEYNLAIEILLKAFRINPKNAICCYNLGFSYWKIGNLEKSKYFMNLAANEKLKEAIIFINEKL